MKKWLIVLIALLLAAACTASAQTVRFEDGNVTLAAMDADGEPLPEPVSADQMVLLGTDEGGNVAIYVNGAVVYASPEALAGLSDGLSRIELPGLGALETLQSGADREDVAQLQQALIDLGYLEGTADGLYGGKSRTAVSAFQEAMGLEATGAADPVTRQLILSLAGEEVTVSTYVDPSVQFEAILDRASDDLSPLFGKGLNFDYDDIAGTGFITNDSAVHLEDAGAADIDRCTQDVTFGFLVVDSNGAVTIRPVAQVVSAAVRRPIVQNMLLKSGDRRVTIKATGTVNGLQGSQSLETVTVNLSATAIELLAHCEEAGELKIRLQGKYQSWDVTVPAEQLAAIAQIGQIAAELTAA